MLLRYDPLVTENRDGCHKSLSHTCRLCHLGVPLVGNLRTRLLALHVLEAILPACEASMEDEQMTQVRCSDPSVSLFEMKSIGKKKKKSVKS